MNGFLFLGLIVMAGFLTYFARITPQLLVRFAAGLVWLALGVWLFFSGEMLDMSANWAKVLAFVFVIMAIVPFTWQMRTDVSRAVSAQGKKESNTVSWTEWGSPPRSGQSTPEERAQKYREQIRTVADRYRRRR